MGRNTLLALISVAVTLGIPPAIRGVERHSEPAKVFAIARLTIDPAHADDFPSYLLAASASRRKYGVDLVASYEIQFGEDTDRIVIWSAADAEALRQSLGTGVSLAPNLRDLVLSETVEVAEQNPIRAATPPDSSGKPKPETVFAIVWVSIRAAQHGNFVATLENQPALLTRYGVRLVASYHIQLGNLAREVDIWSASDAESIRRGFYAPDTDIPAFRPIIESERIEIGLSVEQSTQPGSHCTSVQIFSSQKNICPCTVATGANKHSLVSGTGPCGGSDESAREVAAREAIWLKASATNDPELAAPVLSDRMVTTSVEGRVAGKAEALADVKGYTWTRLENSDMQVRIFGSTAIATFTTKGTGDDPKGMPFSENERWTDTWVKMPNGQWQCVAAHGSNIEP